MVEVFSICSIERRAATPTTRHHNLWRSHSIRATVKINRWQRKPLGELPGRRHPPRSLDLLSSYKTEPAAAFRVVFSWFTGVVSGTLA